MDEESIFAAALDIASPMERQAFLAEACRGDRELSRGVDALLNAHENPDRFLEPRIAVCLSTIDASPAEAAGNVIGSYKLLEQIGAGGMGAVFMAEQAYPVRRKVALKIIKPGMDSEQVVARFEAERQALALMDHPNIAKVFDGGTTESGRPYFVMELVRGLPITDYCDQANLAIPDRLGLFIAVCRAVQHAHQKGVIHRDLKPSNVMVTMVDGMPIPKVIDFGVAKATGATLTERTMFTAFHQLVGTPLYMSPEQAELSGVDVDTRSDVYSLGVLLYELLTGTTPFEPETLKQVGFDEMRRLIREAEPALPSRRLNTLDARACSTVSERRGVDGRRLGRLLRGELDWVVMRALEKDRNRRYESASALATDIERYLADEPVQAGPPSAGYRLRKYAWRHRRLLWMSGVVAATLLAATGASIWQALRARDAQRQAEADRDRAEAAQHRAEAAEGRAATEAAIAQAVNNFLQQDLLRQVDSQLQEEVKYSVDKNLTVKEALNRAASRIGDRFQDQPLVEAAIRATIGDSYRSVGEGSPAVTQLERAVTLRQSLLGLDHSDTLDTMGRLADAYAFMGRWLDAVAMHERIVERRQALLGPDDDDTLTAMSALAGNYARAGLVNQSVSLHAQILEKRKTLLGPYHPKTLAGMDALANVYPYAGRFQESLALYRTTLDLYKKIPGPHQRSIHMFLNGYARACLMAGNLDEGERVARESVQHCQQTNDARSKSNAAIAMANLLPILLKQGRFAEAESMGRQVQEYYEKDPGAFQGLNNYQRFHAMSVVGGALAGQKRYAEAEPLLLQAYEGLQQREATITISFQSWVTAALDRVIQYYEATDQPEEATVWREKRSRVTGPNTW